MPAQITRHQEAPGGARDVDDVISASVDGLRAFRRMSPRDLYTALGLSRTAYYDRLSGTTKWSAADVKRAADALGVSVATLYDGLVLPHLDSNQKPAGYPLDQFSEDEGAPFLPLPRAILNTVIDLTDAVAA